MRNKWIGLLLSITVYASAQAQHRAENQVKKLIDEASRYEVQKNLTAYQHCLSKALAISEAAQLPNYTILLSLDIATAEINKNQPHKALPFIRKANGVYRNSKQKSVRREFMIDYTFALANINLSRYDSAGHYFNQCGTLINVYPDSLRSFNHYLNLYYVERSYLAYDFMAYQEAITLNEEAIRRHKLRNKTADGSGNNYNLLGKAYVALKNFAKADSAFRKAADLYTAEPPYQAIVLCNLTDSKIQQNDSRAARQTLQLARLAYQRYLRQVPQPDADIDRRLKQNEANLLLLEGKLVQAEAAFNDLIVFSRTHFPMPSGFRVDAYISQSRLQSRLGNRTAARKALQNALQEAYGSGANTWERAALPRSLLAALTAKADFWANAPTTTPAQRRTNAREALLAYEQSIDLVTSLRRGAMLPESKSFLAQKAAPLYGRALVLVYELAQQPQYSAVYQQRALALIDKQQNALLNDALLEQRIARQFLPLTLQTEFQSISRRLSQLRLVRENSTPSVATELAKLEKDLIEWQQRVAHDYPAYGQSLRKVARLSMTEYQQQLAPGEVLLCYAPVPDGLLVLTLGRETCTFRRVSVTESKLNQAIDRFRSEVTRAPGIVGGYDEQPALALYKLLVSPIEKQIRDATAISVIAPPHWQIPFEALQNAPGNPLIKQVDVAYQFNLSNRLLPVETRQPQHSVLAMAPFGADTGRGPFRMPTGYLLRGLKASAEELKLVADGLRWLGRQATKQRFLADAPSARMLLLTTHTYPDEHGTALVFHPSTGPNITNYLLYPSELQTCDLGAVEIAALSACATEQGVAVAGDGIHSLGRACAWAGAHNVICSFFSLNDDAQAIAARFFYPKLSNGKSIRENFRQARLEFLASEEGRRYSGHPHYWAGVALYGGHTPLTSDAPWWRPYLLSLLACMLGTMSWLFLNQSKSAPKNSLALIRERSRKVLG